MGNDDQLEFYGPDHHFEWKSVIGGLNWYFIKQHVAGFIDDKLDFQHSFRFIPERNTGQCAVEAA